MIEKLNEKQEKLFRRSKKKLREEAREAYIQGRKEGLTLEEAQAKAEEEIRRILIGFWETILISVAIWFVKLLIEWWWSRGVEDPGSEPLEGEPG